MLSVFMSTNPWIGEHGHILQAVCAYVVLSCSKLCYNDDFEPLPDVRGPIL